MHVYWWMKKKTARNTTYTNATTNGYLFYCIFLYALHFAFDVQFSFNINERKKKLCFSINGYSTIEKIHKRNSYTDTGARCEEKTKRWQKEKFFFLSRNFVLTEKERERIRMKRNNSVETYQHLQPHIRPKLCCIVYFISVNSPLWLMYRHQYK